jgi:hypothetical protein
MAVHVGEIHTELSARSSAAGAADGPPGSPEPRYPGAREDEWRSSQARVLKLRRRVCAEDFDD